VVNSNRKISEIILNGLLKGIWPNQLFQLMFKTSAKQRGKVKLNLKEFVHISFSYRIWEISNEKIWI